MSRRSRLQLPALTAAALGALALAGCGQLGSGTSAQPSAAPASSAASAALSLSPSPSGAKASPSGKTSGKASAPASRKADALPDICTLLSKAEVTGLTGEQVTLMTDEGGGSPASRYCQWQLSQGQLTVSVVFEDRGSFDTRNKESKPVSGIGDTAYSLAGHLYVWEDGLAVDVYVSSESSDTANLNVERQTALKVLPRLTAAR
ncbi:hypothetical protein GCM10010399_84690 [Dactylosporangium fulvum]|uniref:DUF3558 domain-containing protein n=1 Tax=Dactylosporangium fulvum TaxID=53359 RepID=A0ABY5VNH6_9ACTN|nr:hypothetical protein [Dactylosporangium fulvum]UWP78619.1 hypothetical protein Dfulv_25925 [Dactylosporangium fulvum]